MSDAQTTLKSPSPETATYLLERICVSRPYMAWTDLTCDLNLISGTVQAEMKPGNELCSMRAAEAGRHLAILGSIAAANLNSNPGRHFYLAKYAHLSHYYSDNKGEFRGRAAAEIDGRRAQAKATLEGRGEIYDLVVEYDVIRDKVFERAARSMLSETAKWTPGMSNPYSDFKLSEDGRITVTEAMCVGHFERYPALPVAMVMDGLSDAAKRVRGRDLVFVLDGEVWAEHLAVVGDTVVFSAEDRGDHFNCTAITTEGKVIGEMELVIAD